MFRSFRSLLPVAFFVLSPAVWMSGCASQPIKYTALPANSDYNEEISKLDTDIQSARTQQLDLLAPTYFANADRSLSEAKDLRNRSKSSSDILDRVARGEAYLKLAQDRAKVAQITLDPVLTARNNAVAAGAKDAFPSAFARDESLFKQRLVMVEKGDTASAESDQDQLAKDYHNLEIQSLRRNYIGNAAETIKKAKNEGARDYAPQTLAQAEQAFHDVDVMISRDPHSPELADLSKTANDKADLLLRVTRESKMTKEGNSEAAALRLEEQKNKIADLGTESFSQQASLEEQKKQIADLATEKQMNERFKQVQSFFTPEEADVYRSGNQLIIRLKGLHFPVGASEIPSQDFALLNKVQNSLKVFEGGNVKVEGHTDSLGNQAINEKLSADRAKAVRDYLVANGNVPEGQVNYEGEGFSKPIASNKTAEGRAQNRRVDILVEPAQG